MSDESQTQGPTEANTNDATQVATSVEETQSNDVHAETPAHPAEPQKRELSLKETIEQRRNEAHAKGHEGKKPNEGQEQKANPEKPGEQQPEPPKFEPNFKYKAFGKEKELDPFWRDLIKDADSERKVKEVFTRADAFDDMKVRFENASKQMQTVSSDYQELEKDVKRVMHFRNTGDLDNFFAGVQLPKQDIYNWVARQLELEKASPDQQASYHQGVQARAENLYNQQNYQSIQEQFAQQRADMVQMQLDHNLMRPEIDSAARAFDAQMGEGKFRQVVIDEAAFHTYATGGKEIWSPDQAIAHVMQKFGGLLRAQSPQGQVQSYNGQPQTSAPQAGQPQGVVNVQGKPVIPNVNGRGTSPVKQAPKSLAELKSLGKRMRAEEIQGYEAN